MATDSKSRRAAPAPTKTPTQPPTRKAKAKPASSPKASPRNRVATVTVGELRSNFKAVEAKLAKGARVQVTRRGTVVAEVLPPQPHDSGADIAAPTAAKKFEMPDFMARLREIWGDEPLDIDTTTLVSEGRSRDFQP